MILSAIVAGIVAHVDIINGLFEAGGAFFCALNVRRLYKDREVKGVDWRTTAFFTLWGFFNLLLYPTVHLPLSALAAGSVALVNTSWLSLYFWLRWCKDRASKGKHHAIR